MVRTRTRGKPGRGAQAWLDEATDVPRAGLPDEKWSKRARWHRRYVKFSAYALVPVLLLAVFGVFGRPMTSADAGDGVVAGVSDESTIRARAVASTTVEEWLGSETSPLPGGRIVSWNYAEPVPAMSDEQDSTTGQDGSGPEQITAHHFTVSGQGRLFAVQVSTLNDLTRGTVAVDTPSLMPQVPAVEDLSASSPWPGAVDFRPPDVVGQVVSSWAEAFTGGDPDQLRLVTGDPDGSHSYMPLTGADLAGSDVTSVAVPQDLLDDQGRAPDEPERLVVRVRLSLMWDRDGQGQGEGQDDGEGGSEEQGQIPESSRVTYDLLLTGTDTASPRVVAWGGPGSGPSLSPYANAVTGRELTGSDSESSQPSPDTSGSSQAEESQEPAGDNDDEESK